MQRGLQGAADGCQGTGTIADKEFRCEGITPQDSQVEKGLSLIVGCVDITLVTNQCVGNALTVHQQSEIQWQVPATISLIHLLSQLQVRDQKQEKHSQMSVYPNTCMPHMSNMQTYPHLYPNTHLLICKYTPSYMQVHTHIHM